MIILNHDLCVFFYSPLLFCVPWQTELLFLGVFPLPPNQASDTTVGSWEAGYIPVMGLADSLRPGSREVPAVCPLRACKPSMIPSASSKPPVLDPAAAGSGRPSFLTLAEEPLPAFSSEYFSRLGEQGPFQGQSE